MENCTNCVAKGINCIKYKNISCKATREIFADSYNQAVIDYKEKLLKRLIPHLNDLECTKESETYLAITEIANELLK